MGIEKIKRILVKYNNKLFWHCIIIGLRVLLALKSAGTYYFYLGYAYEQIGSIQKSIRYYQYSLDKFLVSNKRNAFKWHHTVQFSLERAYYVAGKQRVEDPLFACSIAGNGMKSAEDDAVGFYYAEFTYAGLKIFGYVADKKYDEISIYIDTIELRKLKLSHSGRTNEFSYTIERPTLDLFPKKSNLSITVDDNNLLFVFKKYKYLFVEIPHGNNTIADVLLNGGKVDKKGNIQPSHIQVKKKQSEYLALYDKARTFFERELSASLFLMYGTLLGYYRDGDFIKGDDDFDVGYISDEGNPLDVKTETLRIIEKLIQAGFTVSFNRRGRLFRLHDIGQPMDSIHLDVRPIWFQDGRVWAHNHFSMSARKENYVPVQKGHLLHTDVYVPRDVEYFLEGQYGKNWVVPDPGFTYHLSEIEPYILDNLEQALITPEEYRNFQHRLNTQRETSSIQGEFISEGLMSLYPLNEGKA